MAPYVFVQLRSMSSKRRCLQWRTVQSRTTPDDVRGVITTHTYYKQIEKDVPRIALPRDVPHETSFRRTASGVTSRPTTTIDGNEAGEQEDEDDTAVEAYHGTEVFKASLARVLHEYAICHPEVGYVQGMHNVVAMMLIAGLDERESFALLHHFAMNVVPKYWHADAKNPILADVVVCSFIARRELPSIAHHLESIGVDLQQLTLPLFLTLFTTSAMAYEFVACCWDFLLFESTSSTIKENGTVSDYDSYADEDVSNNSFMFRVVLAMLKMFEPELLGSSNAVECIRLLVDMPTQFTTIRTGVGDDTGDEGKAEVKSMHDLIVLSADFAETCSPKQIKLLRRELAAYSTPHIDDDEAAAEAEDGLGEVRAGGKKERFQLIRSMSDSQHALQEQIDMMKETLSIQWNEMEKMGAEIDRLKGENTTLTVKVAEKELEVMQLTKESTSLRSELDARKVQVNLLLDQQKEYLLNDIGNGKRLQRTESVGSVDAGRRSPPSPPASPRTALEKTKKSKPALFSRLRKNHT